MFWKGTLLPEPREKPPHSHHPLLYTSPLTDTNLYSFCSSCLTSLALILSSVSLFLALYFCISLLSLYICILPLLVRPAGDLSFFSSAPLTALQTFLLGKRKVQCEAMCKSVSAKCKHLWIYILFNQYFECGNIFAFTGVSQIVSHPQPHCRNALICNWGRGEV